MDSIYSVHVCRILSLPNMLIYFVTFGFLFKWLPAMADTFRVSFDEFITILLTLRCS